MTELDLIDIFRENLIDMMKEVGITRKELALEASLSESSINKYLAGDRMPTIKAIVNICYTLECDLNDLIPTYDKII